MTLRIVHVSDTHIGSTPDYTLYGHNTYHAGRVLVDYVNDALPFAPDLILHTGDVCYNPDPLAAKLAYDLLSQFKYPLYVTRGNHDDPDALRDYFPHLPAGKGRIDYDFVVKGYHFIVLDSFGHVQPAGYLEPEQLDWLATTLGNSTAEHVVMVVHHLPTMTGNAWLDERMNIKNLDLLFDVLAPHHAKIRVMLYGHIHVASTQIYRGIVCSSAPATFSQFIFPQDPAERFTVTAPGGLSLLTLEDDRVSVLHYQLGDPPNGH